MVKGSRAGAWILAWVAALAGAQAAPAPSPFAIPLTKYHSADGALEKVGLEVSVGTAGPQMFALDTGSTPFRLDQSAQHGGTTNTGSTGSITYGIGSSGTVNYDIYTGGLTFISDTNDSLTVNATFGVTTSTVNFTPDDRFEGILGANPAAPESPQPNSLYTLLGQVDFASLGTPEDPVLPGFTVSLEDQRLYLGISTSYWNSLSAVAPMAPDGSQTFPGTNILTARKEQVNLTADLDGNPATTAIIPGILDTGAPDVSFIEGTDLAVAPGLITTVNVGDDPPSTLDYLMNGVEVKLEGEAADGHEAWLVDYLATLHQDTDGKRIDDNFTDTFVTMSSHSGAVNTGLLPFTVNDITFRFGTVSSPDGFVGFRAVPEPATGGLILGGAAACLLLRRRR